MTRARIVLLAAAGWTNQAIARKLPATRGVPLGRWSLTELRTEVLATGLVDEVSTTTLWRWLQEDPIK